jgi:hypothetical protein
LNRKSDLQEKQCHAPTFNNCGPFQTFHRYAQFKTLSGRKKGTGYLNFCFAIYFHEEKIMSLREVTRTVIKLVEDASGCPVVVSEDASLNTLAASRIARLKRDLQNLVQLFG